MASAGVLISVERSSFEFKAYKEEHEWIDRTPKEIDLSAVKQKHSKLLQKIKERRVCVQCGIQYNPTQNLEARQCLMHTGWFNRGVRPPMYKCCGDMDVSSMGCTPCVHVSDETIRYTMKSKPSSAVIRVPRELVDYEVIRINFRNVVRTEESYYVIAMVALPYRF